ncbi:hypothetical protein DL93DRAFT_436816 [Clavulina sp. PMI_390]|nr:hypothetical protein DL93DRAFT_436816 [Clavulina sp. PMI_390]
MLPTPALDSAIPSFHQVSRWAFVPCCQPRPSDARHELSPKHKLSSVSAVSSSHRLAPYLLSGVHVYQWTRVSPKIFRRVSRKVELRYRLFLPPISCPDSVTGDRRTSVKKGPPGRLEDSILEYPKKGQSISVCFFLCTRFRGGCSTPTGFIVGTVSIASPPFAMRPGSCSNDRRDSPPSSTTIRRQKNASRKLHGYTPSRHGTVTRLSHHPPTHVGT